jgi:hypothetical protein
VCVSSLISSVGIGISVLVGGTYSHKLPRSVTLPAAVAPASLITSLVLRTGPERTNCTWDDTPVLQTFAGARDNDGQGVVCVLQGTPDDLPCVERSDGSDDAFKSYVHCCRVTLAGMMVMFGALAGSFWWVMLTYTIFQFLVFEISSDRARRMVCPWLQRSRTVPTHAQDCQKLTSFSISLATVAHRLSHRELGHPDTPRDHRYKRVRAFPADAFLSRDATDDVPQLMTLP